MMGLMKRLPLLIFILILLCSENKVDGQDLTIVRKIPLCLQVTDPNLNQNGQLRQFIPIITDLQDENKYFNKERLTKVASRHEILDTIEFAKIKLQRDSTKWGFPNDKVLADKPLGDISSEFHQWMHIKVKAKVKLQGLIVGAMHGPLGLPIGTFAGFKGAKGARCSCDNGQSDVMNFLSLPCTRRSKASLLHPDVFVWHSEYMYTPDELDSSPVTPPGSMTDIHFNFNYIDVKCHRASIMQFYVIAVENFATTPPKAEAVLTHVLIRRQPSSIDGSPYPFHPDFCKALDCGDDTVPVNNAVNGFEPDIVFNETAELRFNIEYDLCVKFGSGNKTCPPGPFNCTDPVTLPVVGGADPNDPATVMMTQADLETKSKEIEDMSKDPPCNCPPVIRPPNLAGPESVRQGNAIIPQPWIDYNLIEDKRVDKPIVTTKPPAGTRGTVQAFRNLQQQLRENIEAQRTLASKTETLRIIHGQLMFLAFSIFGSISVFIARFDKDLMPGVGCCGRGVWLWVHILVALSSMVLMWGGLFILLPTVTGEWNLKIAHSMIGAIGMILFHYSFFTGWVRPVGRTYRGIFISIHSIIGYSAKLFGAIPMFITQGRYFTIVIVIVAEFLNLLFYAANTVVQVLTDSHMEMRTPRKICPYLENKELQGPVPATCNMARNLIMLVHSAVLVLIFIISVPFWPKDYRVRSYYDILVPGHWGEADAEGAAGSSNKTG